MAFDPISFILGVGAGALTGALAGVLHNLERTADLQEKLRETSRELARLSDMVLSSHGSHVSEKDAKVSIEQLRRDLEEIHEEIRKMYKRTSR